MNEKSDKEGVSGTNRRADVLDPIGSDGDVIEPQVIGTKTRSLNLKSGMTPDLERWTEELLFYEHAFPKYDEHGRVENAGAIIPHRSGWIFWLAGVKLHQC